TCTATDRYSMAGSPALPSGPDRRSRCCRRRMPRAISSRSSSGCRSGSSLKDTTRTSARCSSALRSFHTSISTSRRPGPMPGSFCKPMRRDRRHRVRRGAARAPKNDGRGPCTLRIPRGRKPLGYRRYRRDTDLHGGARYDDHGGRAAIHRRRPVGYGRRRRMGHHQLPRRQRHHPADHRLVVGAPRPPKLLPAVDSRVHPCLGAVWNGHQSRSAVVFRVVQGLAGGGLQPSSQGVLLDAFPREKHGVAMTLFGLAALLAPVVGPTLGGWITDSYSWRWGFFINVPVGLLALGSGYSLLPGPDYFTQQRAELKRRPFSFDSIGLSLLVIVMVSWEVMLSKGQEWDWLNDPFWRVQTLATFFAVGLIALIVWELRPPSPVVNFRPVRERNFSACCVIIFCAFPVLYAASTSLPGLLQSLFGYDALNAGLVMSPAGFFAVVAMPVVGFLLGRGTDARWMIAAGLLIMAAGNYWMSQLNLEI